MSSLVFNSLSLQTDTSIIKTTMYLLRFLQRSRISVIPGLETIKIEWKLLTFCDVSVQIFFSIGFTSIKKAFVTRRCSFVKLNNF